MFCPCTDQARPYHSMDCYYGGETSDAQHCKTFGAFIEDNVFQGSRRVPKIRFKWRERSHASIGLTNPMTETNELREYSDLRWSPAQHVLIGTINGQRKDNIAQLELPG